MLALIALLTAPALAQDLDADGYDVRYDCDDNDASVYPGAPELCDGRDNDCDGTVEDLTVDTDGDGVPDDCDTDADGDGVPAGQDCDDNDPTIGACVDADGDGFTTDDCDDSDASIFPGAPEICGNGVDEDCDGALDNGCDTGVDTGFVDNDNDGYGRDDCDDNDASVNPGAPEICGNAVDDNCNGRLDDGCDTGVDTGFVDNDNDGYGPDDCDDDDASIYPGAPELCDGIDSDCDGIAEDLVDADGDGIVDDCIDADQDGILASEDCDDNDASVGEECRDVDQDGDGWPANEDCDDTDASIHPNAPEVCDGIDQDCNGVIDDGFELEWFEDQDGDGFGSGSALSGCQPDASYVSVAGDCDDSDASVSPGASEICDNGVDENCNGLSDEGCDPIDTGVDDLDGDGYGADDCDDTDASVNPGATEICGNGIDEDCDGRDPACTNPTTTDPTTTDPGTTDTGDDEDDKGTGCSTAGGACMGTGGTYSLLLLPLGLWRRRRA